MNLYFFKYSALCLISILSFMNYAIAQEESGRLRIHNNVSDKNLLLGSIIFGSTYSVPADDCKDGECFILNGTYPEIKISARFRNSALPDIPCSPTNVTVNGHTRLILTVQAYENRPDRPTCTIQTEPM